MRLRIILLLLVCASVAYAQGRGRGQGGPHGSGPPAARGQHQAEAANSPDDNPTQSQRPARAGREGAPQQPATGSQAAGRGPEGRYSQVPPAGRDRHYCAEDSFSLAKPRERM